jgi:NAD-dependent SIR2 family protein deacetylase
MQFVTNGPDIPDALLQAHEDGQVVFFCGAGISYPAGLPDFKGLVDRIYDAVGTPQDPKEKTAYEREEYDTTLNLLEKRITGGRRKVRDALIQVLQPGSDYLSHPGITDTHTALLELATSRNGNMRLVTTNFDRIFEHLLGKNTQRYQAPLLPIPKNSRWNGLVYLHGLMPEQTDESAFNNLVLTVATLV